MLKKRTLMVLLSLIVLIAILPLVIHRLTGSDDQFAGADNQAQQAITTIDPGFQPWFRSIFKPASTEVESFLFALQAAIGSGLIGYYLGRNHLPKKDSQYVD